ncbi:MarR family winged helix-turn-helix transcriptional regulator [Ramlibacter sp. XY19]|uniref:MarR family winged helix-turn-helix transcriptional regulator n=1 Tax=Ramlibacter paludis TaxID=2908000 RepID=UPI0023D98696|nr:MarR family winged helix-turn-helix transcriptional regulator [Ramlibacter paludis]MCG2592191.1 MarR family winged helix-turn-helix transcriptional regulator [Ramlibacter paludis]
MPTSPSRTTRKPRLATSDPLNEPATRVLRRFRLVFNTVKAHFRSVERQAGVAGAQVWALSVVAGEPGIGVSALARAMDVHQSTASNLIKPLLEGGLLAAERSGSDRRAVQLRVTAQGTRVLRKAPGPFTGVLPDALAHLDAATLARLDRDLGKLIQVLGVAPTGEKEPLGRPEE